MRSVRQRAAQSCYQARASAPCCVCTPKIRSVKMCSCASCVNVAIAIVTILVCFVYGYCKYTYGYWARRNVASLPAVVPFGNIADVVFRKKNFTDKLRELYRAAKAKKVKCIGSYFFTRKVFIVTGPDLIKRVLSTDFQHFHDRTLQYDERKEPLSAHLVALTGNKWKRIRAKLTPTFTSGKLKTMFHTVRECGDELVRVLGKNSNEPVEVKDIVSRFTTDVIGSCALGINCNSLENPDAEFRRMGKRVFRSGMLNALKLLLMRNFPWLWRQLGFKQIDPEVSAFFINAVRETVEHRWNNNVMRDDMLQILMELMDRKRAEDKAEEGAVDRAEDNTVEAPLTMNEVAAQSFVMFLAGYETSASTVTFALYELALHTSIQNNVRREIGCVLDKHDGNVTYEALGEMPELEKVICETLRHYPPFQLLARKCTKTYKIPHTNTIIEEGTSVIIPLHALHHDPDFFPDPDKFDPDRFNPEAVKSRQDSVYLPFGNGPRICIGLRFAMIQVKIALVLLLKNFEFTLNERTRVPLQTNMDSFILTPLGGVWFNVNQIQSN